MRYRDLKVLYQQKAGIIWHKRSDVLLPKVTQMSMEKGIPEEHHGNAHNDHSRGNEQLPETTSHVIM